MKSVVLRIAGPGGSEQVEIVAFSMREPSTSHIRIQTKTGHTLETWGCCVSAEGNVDELPNALPARVMVAVHAAGVVYCDRQVEVNGDYKRLAFLPYDTLVLEWGDCPSELLRREIERDASVIQAQRGQLWQVSTCGQTVLLGRKGGV